MSERIKRFDDIFRFLVIISTIIFSGALSFYKEHMSPYFFSGYIYTIIASILIWSIGHTRKNISKEALTKLISWLVSMFFVSGNIWCLVYRVPTLQEEPLIIIWILLIISYSLTLPMCFYLKNILPKRIEIILIGVVILAGTTLSLTTELIKFI